MYYVHGYDFSHFSETVVDSIPGEIRYGTGRGGDAFVFDTAGLHSGMRCHEGRRLAIVLYPRFQTLRTAVLGHVCRQRFTYG